ncbi:MAG: stage V sporulation protein AD [Clostridia bacterium]
MMIQNKTIILEKPVYIKCADTIAGELEGKGAFANYYDMIIENTKYGCKTHEQAEIKMHKEVMQNVLKKQNLTDLDLDLIIGGDLLNQIITASYSAREFNTAFLGIYSACSTFGACLGVGAVMLQLKHFKNILCCTSSHYCTAERLYRFPLELGTIPMPTSQTTVTGAGACLLTNQKCAMPQIKAVTFGKVLDLGVKDSANMGGAMAPACCHTIARFFEDTHLTPDYFDLILTGDLGRYGRDVLYYLCKEEGLILDNLNDCGAMIFTDKQKVCQGGSGAGCSSVVFCSYIYKEMLAKNIKKVLFVPTGALLSKTSSLQGESIPCVAHAVSIEMED